MAEGDDPFATLGVKSNASTADVKAAYRSLGNNRSGQQCYRTTCFMRVMNNASSRFARLRSDHLMCCMHCSQEASS